MRTFKENRADLPAIDGIRCLELLGADGSVTATIENKAGSQGSLRVYLHLLLKYGAITPAAAKEGLDLFAEHTADARAHPGSHPNIDRLIDIVSRGSEFAARIVAG